MTSIPEEAVATIVDEMTVRLGESPEAWRGAEEVVNLLRAIYREALGRITADADHDEQLYALTNLQLSVIAVMGGIATRMNELAQ